MAQPKAKTLTGAADVSNKKKEKSEAQLEQIKVLKQKFMKSEFKPQQWRVLIFGYSDYVGAPSELGLPSMLAPTDDCARMAALLKEWGVPEEDIQNKFGEPPENIDKWFSEMKQEYVKSKKPPVRMKRTAVFIYYSGHGVSWKSQTAAAYWDKKTKDVKYIHVMAKAIELSNYQDYFVMGFFDCCRAPDNLFQKFKMEKDAEKKEKEAKAAEKKPPKLEPPKPDHPKEPPKAEPKPPPEKKDDKKEKEKEKEKKKKKRRRRRRWRLTFLCMQLLLPSWRLLVRQIVSILNLPTDSLILYQRLRRKRVTFSFQVHSMSTKIGSLKPKASLLLLPN